MCQEGVAPILGSWGIFCWCMTWVDNHYLLGLKSPFFTGNRSNFLGTKFTVYDAHPPIYGAKVTKSRSTRLVSLKQVSPRVPAGNYAIVHVSYDLNVLGSRYYYCVTKMSLLWVKRIMWSGIHQTKIFGDFFYVIDCSPLCLQAVDLFPSYYVEFLSRITKR